MSQSEESIDSTPNKRARKESFDGNTVFLEPHRPELNKFLNLRSDYVHLFIPKNLADAFSTFLNGAKARQDKDEGFILDKNLHNPDKEPEHLTKKFQHMFNGLTHDIANDLNNYKAEDFFKRLDQTDFEAFKRARSKLSYWFTSGSHLLNKLRRPSDTNSYLKVGLNFSPTVKNQDIRYKCTEAFHELKEKLETTVTSQVLKDTISFTENLNEEWMNTKKDQHEHFILCKAFRSVLLYNRDISRDLLHFIPKGFFTPSDSDSSFRLPRQTNDVVRHTQRTYHRKRVSYAPESSDTNTNDSEESQSKQPLRNESDRENTRRRSYRPSEDRYSRSDSSHVSSYEDEYPAYDDSYNQKKQRYKSHVTRPEPLHMKSALKKNLTESEDEEYQTTRRPHFKRKEPEIVWV